MKLRTKTAIVLIGLGLVSFALGGLKFSSREEVFKVADFRATTTTKRTFPAFRYCGVSLIAVGGIVIALGVRRTAGTDLES